MPKCYPKLIQFILITFFSLIYQSTLQASTARLDWMKLSEEAGFHWSYKVFPDRPDYMSILPTDNKKSSQKLKRIIVLLPKKSPSYSIALSTILESLYYEEILASITVINFNRDEKLGRAGLKYAEKENADLIFSLGSETAAFLTKTYKKGAIPVVTAINKDPVLLGQVENYDRGSRTNIAYTSLNIPVDLQMEYLFGVKPNLKNVVLLYNKNHQQVVKTEVEPVLKYMKPARLNVLKVAVSSLGSAKGELEQQLPRVIQKLKKNDPQLKKSVFWVTSSTAVFSNISTVNWYADKIPVIGSNPNLVTENQEGIVLGIGIDRQDNARLACRYAIQILNGDVKPGNLKVGIVEPPDLAINYKIAKKIGLKVPFSFFNDTGLSWLDFSFEALSRYQSKISEENRSMMHVSPWFTEDDFIKKKVLILVPKKSKSYSIAISKFLEQLYEAKISGDITIINFAKNEEYGKVALSIAEQKEVDLIFSVGSETAAFLHKNYTNAWIPVVTSTAKDPVALKQVKSYRRGSGTNIAYTSLNVPVSVQMNYFLWLKPKLKTIGVLYNPHHKQVLATEVLPLKRYMAKKGIKVVDIKVDSVKTAKADLSKQIPRALKQMRKKDRYLGNSLLWMTSSTVLFSQMKTINRYAGKVPVIASNTNAVVEGDHSALMAFGIDRGDNAKLASLYAVEILKNDANAGEFKVGLVLPPTVVASFRIARKIGFEFPYDFFTKRSFEYSGSGDIAHSKKSEISIK